MDSEITFRIEGPEARAVSEALLRQVEQEFGVGAELRVATQADTTGTRTDPVAVVGLAVGIASLAMSGVAVLLSIPAALLATLDLVERVKKKEKVERILSSVREAPPSTQILLQTPDRKPKDARDAHPADLLDPAAAALRAGRVRGLEPGSR